MSDGGAAPIQQTVGATFTPLPEGAASAVGDAVAGAGKALDDFGLQYAQAQQQKDLVNARLTATKSLDDLTDQFRTDTDPATMPDRFAKAAADIGKQAGSGLFGAAATQFQDEFAQMAESRRVGVKDMAFGRTVSQANASLDDTIETNTRNAAFATNPAERASAINSISQGVNGLVATGMLSAEDGQKKMETAQERLALYDGKSAVLLDPTTALANLKNPDYLPKLDPLSRVELQNSADSEIRVRAREAQAALGQARMEATQAANDFHDVIVSGLPVSQEVIDTAKAAAINSHDPHAMARFAGLLKAKEVVDSLRGAGPRELDAAQAQLENQANSGGGANEAMATALTASRKFNETMTSALTHDPLMWGADQGVVPVKPLQLNGTDQPGDFAARIKQAEIVSRKYGVPFQPLTAAESDTLKSFLGGQNVDQKLATLKMITAGFGSYAVPVLSKLGASDPATARAAALVASGPARYGAARDVLTGIDVLKGTPDLRPTAAAKANAGLPALTSAYGGMPDELAGVTASMDAIYAARAPRQGLTGADAANTTNGKGLLNRAFQEAAGARFEADGTQWGGVTDYNGRSVVAPPMVRADGFEDLAHQLTPADLAKASLSGAPPVWQGGDAPANLMAKTWLISGPNGTYGLSATDPAKGNVQPVQDKSGKPFRFSFGTALAVLSARTKGGH